MEAVSIPRIYVGTYAKYTNGSTAGKWLNLSDYATKEEFYKACKKLHKDERTPEFMFQDFENFPKTFYCESHLGDDFFEYVSTISNMDEDKIEPFNWFITDVFGSWTNSREMTANFEASFQGNYSSTSGDTEMNFTNQYVDEHIIHEIPEHLQTYFDYEQYSRTLFFGEYTSVSGFVYCTKY